METGDDMAEFAISYLLSGRGSARRLVHALATGWPKSPALELILALSLSANGIESMLSNPEIVALAQEAWRMAALLGVDIFAAQALGLAHHTAADMLAYWQAHDPFFLPS